MISEENEKVAKAIDEMDTLIDTYHALPDVGRVELASLWRIRRDMVHAKKNLARMIKPAYGDKALLYVYRKYAVAREIVAAMEIDAKQVGLKKRAMNVLEAQTEALDSVLQAKKRQVQAEALYEQASEMLKAADRALFALGQEINEGMAERSYQNSLALIDKKAQPQ